tara:strand:- start:459 stop:662 length:204 start_codon:yes stop_codon:yes gene_type:complete
MVARVLAFLLTQPQDRLEALAPLVLLGLLIPTLAMYFPNLQFAEDILCLRVLLVDGLYTNGMEVHGI